MIISKLMTALTLTLFFSNYSMLNYGILKFSNNKAFQQVSLKTKLTPLMRAVLNQNKSKVVRLLQKSVNIDLKTDSGETALSLAKKYQYCDICRLISSYKSLRSMNRIIKTSSVYKHYSGKKYKVIAIANDSENPELKRVVYQGLYNCPKFGKNPIWVRPYDMFTEVVIINEIPQFRFEEVSSL